MKINTKRLDFEYLIIFSLLFLIAVIALNPAKYMQTTLNGLNVWAIAVLPGLLPFFFLTKLLTSSSKLTRLTAPLGKVTKLFNCPSVSGYVYFMSLIGGYPMGAKLTAELYENKIISAGQAHRMTAFCSTSGPMFIIGSVGASMLLSPTCGIVILVSHIISSLFNGLIYRKVKLDKTSEANYISAPPSKNLLNESMYNTITSCLLVGGFIAFSFVLIDILLSLKLLTPLSAFFDLILKPFNIKAGSAISAGLIEVTRGCMDVAALKLSPLLGTIVCGGLISFGGLSIHLQSLIYLNTCGIKYKYFLLTKATQAVLCMVLCFVFGLLLI